MNQTQISARMMNENKTVEIKIQIIQKQQEWDTHWDYFGVKSYGNAGLTNETVKYIT